MYFDNEGSLQELHDCRIPLKATDTLHFPPEAETAKGCKKYHPWVHALHMRNILRKSGCSIPTDFSATKLNLNRGILVQVPCSIAFFKNLQQLNLNENNLVELPESLGDLVYLKKLSVCKNKITLLPTRFSLLTCLKIFKISNNLLTSFPHVIRSLTDLKELDLSCNPLTTLSGIEQLEDLTFLSLKNIIVTETPEIGHYLKTLQKKKKSCKIVL